MEREMRLQIYEKELRRLLLDLRDHDFVIFEDSRDTERYVQFMVHDSAVLGEVGSKHWMPESSGLRKTSVTALYAAMRDALRRGDWAAFGRAFDELGRLLGPPRAP